MIDSWTKGRGALVMTLEEASRAVKYSFPLKESMYTGGNPNSAKRGYRGFEERPKWNGVHDTESYISSAIRMQILAAWDESFRQGSAEFYDRQFADALAVWNQNRATEFPAQPTTPVAGETLDNATMAQNGGVSGDGL
ncbi:hypothetical protein V495_08629 [Pseudogymnoascus sp. VKM F-4514 (FW-929)]|nr:hypothetical protein V495_08629 [Pseudogymnoascus sp. VKM F-4514 (FW-929)]KFY60564.1 hypothetical protein V497_03544 [Pseudogymnoascus sp. VKM F-4516 (FW-969)]